MMASAAAAESSSPDVAEGLEYLDVRKVRNVKRARRIVDAIGDYPSAGCPEP